MLHPAPLRTGFADLPDLREAARAGAERAVPGGDDDDRRRDDEPEGLSHVARSMQRAEPYFRAAWNLTGGVALGVIAGYLADRHWGTAPWLLVAGSVLGMAAGMYGFFKAVADAERRRGSGRG